MSTDRFIQDIDDVIILDAPKVKSRAAIAIRRNRQETLVHQAADAHLDEMRAVIHKAFNIGRAAINQGQLQDTLKLAHQHGVEVATAGAPEAVRVVLKLALPPLLRKILAAGGNAGLQILKKQLRVASSLRVAADDDDDDFLDMEFDIGNELAEEWAADHAAELAKDLSETTRQDIADEIVDAFAGGDLNAARDAIMDAVGDMARGELIARTEIMTAANAGQRQGWMQAIEKGMLQPSARKEWIAVEDACDECADLDGQTASIDGDYPGEGEDGPPLHPNCRCSEGISADQDEGDDEDDE